MCVIISELTLVHFGNGSGVFHITIQIQSKENGCVRPRIVTADYNLNLDDMLSKFICLEKDIIQSDVPSLPLFSCKFRKDKQNEVLAVSDEDGYITLYDTDRGNKLLKRFQAHHNAIFDICWMPDNFHMLTAAGDHNVSLWDIDNLTRVNTFAGHSASVKSVDVCQSQSEIFATGSRDGNICVWDRREKRSNLCNKPSLTISSAHVRKPNLPQIRRPRLSYTARNLSSVSAVAFQDCYNLASAGAADGSIKIWDLRKAYVMKGDRIPTPRYQIDYDAGHGCTSLAFDSVYKKLYASSTSNKIYQFDCHSYSQKFMEFEGFQCLTYFIKLSLSCDDQYLLCGSSNHKAYIWNTSKPGFPILELPGHKAEVTAVHWSPNRLTQLVTTSDDCKLHLWRMKKQLQFENRDIFAVASPYTKIVQEAIRSNPIQQTTVHQDHSQNIAVNISETPSTSTQTPKPTMKPITSFFKQTPKEKTVSPENILTRSPCKSLNIGELPKPETSAVFVTPGKENGNRSRQVKRKLELSSSKPSSCKHHPEGCGKSRGHISCGKRIGFTPENKIEKYFRASSSPDK